jgi:hypothetical protein
MVSQLRKIGYSIIFLIAAVSTFVIILKSRGNITTFFGYLIGWHLLPYVLMLGVFSKVKQDKFMKYHLFALVLAAGSGLYLLLDAAYIAPSPLAFLAIPLVQILCFLILTIITEGIRYFRNK